MPAIVSLERALAYLIGVQVSGSCDADAVFRQSYAHKSRCCPIHVFVVAFWKVASLETVARTYGLNFPRRSRESFHVGCEDTACIRQCVHIFKGAIISVHA